MSNFLYVINIAERLLVLKNKPRIIAQDPIGVYIRQYTGEIDTLFGRDVSGYIDIPSREAVRINNLINSPGSDYNEIKKFMLDEGYDYLIVSENNIGESFELVDSINGYILEKYGAEALHADYVQAGHHGWQVPMEVYEAIKPGEMFIDAMDELINSPDYVDRHGVLVRWCQEHGIPYHTLNGTPYSIELK